MPTVKKSPPPWSAAISPSPDWTMERADEVEHIEVVARWWGYQGEAAPSGPRQVLITISDGAPAAVRQRGINSGVLRRVEVALADMHDVATMPSVNAYDRMARDYTSRRVAELPPSPRVDRDAYYRGLLDIYEDLVSKGHPEPVVLLSRVMEVSRETVKTRLRSARALKASGTNSPRRKRGGSSASERS